MKLYPVLLALATDPLERARAVEALARVVHRRAAVPVASRNREMWLIDHDDRYDVAQDVLLRLIERPELVVRAVTRHAELGAAIGDPLCVVAGAVDPSALAVAESIAAAYLERMLAHRWLDILRERMRRRALPADLEIHGSAVAADAGKSLMVASFLLLHKALAHLRARSGARAAGYDQSFLELVDLAARRVSMRELTAREMEGDADLLQLAARDPERGTKVARDRLQMRHSRLRRYLRRSVASLQRIGAISVDEVSEAEEALERLMRLRRTASPGGEDEAAPPASVERPRVRLRAEGSFRQARLAAAGGSTVLR